MKKETLGQKFVCALWVFAGAVILGLGIVMVLQSGVGVDPLTMFQEGLAKTLGVPTGSVVFAFNMSTLAIGFLINRRRIGWGSLISCFFIGPSVTFFTNLGVVPSPESFVSSLIMNIAGIAVVGFGIAVYMVPDWGMGGTESVMIFIAEKLHKPYGIVRICMDSTLGVIGFFLGGTLGLGTVLGAVGIGSTMDFFYHRLCKAMKVEP